ncbi:lysozyme [Paraurantiacibacter namhicola]|uniref:lysozyme n=1 Tax=Paraurantiacibacter namhicola TaxID=645517 RepID=UPI001F22798A|nr:lysozyme [Paraurantiacibacter namhicola]
MKQREALRRQKEEQEARKKTGWRNRRRRLSGRMRKRKIALAASAGIMGISTAATVPGTQQSVNMQQAIERVAPDIRTSAALMKASDELKAAMIEEEGVRYTVYRDVAGYPTVGVGHLIKPGDGLSVGDRVTEEQVLEFLEQDLAIAEAGVARLVGDLPLFQHEFDALVDLVYNVGEGNVSPGKSPKLNAAISAGDYQAIADELAYHNAGGALARGLVYRSERRVNIFLEAAYEDPRELRTEINRSA